MRMLANLVVSWPHQTLQPSRLPAAYAGSGCKTACALCQRQLAALEAAKIVLQAHYAETQAHAPPAIIQGSLVIYSHTLYSQHIITKLRDCRLSLTESRVGSSDQQPETKQTVMTQGATYQLHWKQLASPL